MERNPGAKGRIWTDRRIFSRIGLAMFLFIAIQQAVAGAAVVILSEAAPELAQAGWYIWVISYVPLYFLAFPVMALLLRGIPDSVDRMPPEYPEQRQGMRASHMLLLFLACLGITYSLNMASMAVSSLIQKLTGHTVTNFLEVAVTGSDPWVNLFFVALVAPVMEEIVFRLFLYRKLIAYGEKTYILLSALIFALFHVNFYQLAYAFVLGAVFAAIVCRTGTIRHTVALHIAINFAGSGVSALILAYGGEQLLGIWGVAIVCLMAVGLLVCFWWLTSAGRSFRPQPGVWSLPSTRVIFLNPGMILYLLLTVSFAVMAMLM